MTTGNTAKNQAFLPNSKWRQLLVAVTIALTVWLLDFFGALPALDDLGYDACLRVTSAASSTPAHVLLVYVDRKQMADGSEVPESLSRTLLDLGARQIGITYPLSQPTPGLLRLAKESGNIILSREFRASEFDPDTMEFSSESAAGQLPLGLVGLSPGTRGVYRSHFGRLLVNESWQPSLESMIAREVLQDHKNIPDGDFRVAFRGGPGSLPHVDYESVVAGNLVRELVKGKVVLIGLKPDPAFPGIATPTTHGKVKMSLLEFHGHVLQSLLIAAPIHVLHPVARFILLLVSALICHVVLQAIRFKWGLQLVIGVLLLESAIALVLLGWLSIWIPCAPLVVVQILCFAEVNLKKFRFCEQAIDGALLGQSIRLRRRRIPTGFYATDEPWSQLTSLLYQQFYLNRLIVLEGPEDSDYLVAVKAVNCGLEDIEEKRRDYRRWPYSAAVESRLPMRLDTGGYSFFVDQDEDERQFLVKLKFNDQFLGFLAIGVAAKYLEMCPDFGVRLQSAADEFASLLHRWRWVRSQREFHKSWRGRLSSMPEEEPFKQLGRANDLLESRLDRLETAYESSDTACAIYDMFGQLLFMNGPLTKLLREKGIVPRETSALDLICAMTGRDFNSCRKLLQQIAGEKRSSSFQMTLDNPSRVFQLNIRPLQLDNAATTVLPEEADPFQLHGIHIELVDGTPFVEMHEAKDRITDRLCEDVSNSLDEVQRLVAQLAQHEQQPQEQRRVTRTVEQSLLDTVTALQEFQGFIKSDLINEPGDCLPFDASVALRQVFETTVANGSQVLDVRMLLPDVVGDVVANPQLISQAFSALLDVILYGASNNPVISVRAEEDINDIGFVMETADVSASVDELRRVLVEGEETVVAELRQLREVRDWVDQWGGRIVVSTDEDRGIVIKLVLRRHFWMSDTRPSDSDRAREEGKQK